MKIIGGLYRGRWIDFPDAEGLRPTGNRIRETLFNWLGQRLDGKKCLDLFAGSGALGFEAASRGAAGVVMLESSAQVVGSLRANRERLGAANCAIESGDALSYLTRSTAKFDVIFADPPFSTGLMGRVLVLAAPRLSESGLLYCEWATPIEPLLGTHPKVQWDVVKAGKAGVVHFALLKCRPLPP